MLHCTLELGGYHTAVGRSLDELEAGIERAAGNAAQEGAEEARRVGRFQDRTGQLRRNIAAFRVGGGFRTVQWHVLAPLPYSEFVEAGTKPHRIEARNAESLRWVNAGGVHFARVVNHPGSRAFPFMGPGLLKSERVLFRDLELLVTHIGKYWSG